MTDEERDDVLADIAEVAAAMIAKSLGRQGLQLSAEFDQAFLVPSIFNLLDKRIEAKV